MTTKNPKLTSFDLILDKEFGKEGSPSRHKFNQEAEAFGAGQTLLYARQEANVTRAQLAKRVGKTKSYIELVEYGDLEPNINMYQQMVNALGCSIEIYRKTQLLAGIAPKNQKPIRYNLAQLLTQLRQDANVTQAQLAKRIGRSSSYISKIENEKTEPGTGIYLYMLKKLGYSFDVNP
ncbi:MAG: helix-turn-helix domain-containing protein [Salinivirgaceae bacterium]|jgi:transcriptional regulator with XRE-family HTH domain|nr:XRE family transcriptional regulator [Bacteroidales bacterium]